MNLEFVRAVGRDNPTWLPTNIGRTCYAHTVELVRRIREAGHDAYLVCKMAGEGGYTPPGFVPRAVEGFDGKFYMIARVSHDVIYFDGKQFDTLASANEYDRPIYRRQGDPNWSFDSNDGPQIQAVPVWNEIPRELWRPNNPPFKGDIEIPMPVPPVPPPPAPRMKSYEDLGGDAGGIKITRQLEADYKRAGLRGLDGACGAWIQRVSYDFLAGICPTVEAAIAKHREEWCQTLGINAD